MTVVIARETWSSTQHCHPMGDSVSQGNCSHLRDSVSQDIFLCLGDLVSLWKHIALEVLLVIEKVLFFVNKLIFVLASNLTNKFSPISTGSDK